MRYKINARREKTKELYKYVLIGLGVVVGLYAIFMGAYYVTSTPGFCATCHEVAPYVQSWKQSPHKKFGCLYCHESRGFLGKIHSKARGTNYVYQQFAGQYSELLGKAQIFEQNCIDCHFEGYRGYPNTIKLDKKHYYLIKNGRSCLECHRETGHKKAIMSKEKLSDI